MLKKEKVELKLKPNISNNIYKEAKKGLRLSASDDTWDKCSKDRLAGVLNKKNKIVTWDINCPLTVTKFKTLTLNIIESYYTTNLGLFNFPLKKGTYKKEIDIGEITVIIE